ncbi:hypothetical protein ACFVH0_13150 [Streptomyces sp. NPDC127117]|uniref:hypothetical protein n=1 Tax=Streptomyces sp. NPDC127117 TaxID=3345368 RepID=UPI00362CA641
MSIDGPGAANASRPCGTPHHGPFTTGNVLRTPHSVLAARAEQGPWVAEAMAGIADCRTQYEHFSYCRGGQATSKHFETGRLDATETACCRTSRIGLLEGILRHAAERPAPEQDIESSVTLTGRIEASRHELTLEARETDECHDNAGIFGWEH